MMRSKAWRWVLVGCVSVGTVALVPARRTGLRGQGGQVVQTVAEAAVEAAGHGWLILLALAVLAATAHLASLQCRPWTSGKGCSRSGKSRDPAFRSTSGTCRACGGLGREPRVSASCSPAGPGG